MELRDQLMLMVIKLFNRSYSVSQFHDNFYWFYADEMDRELLPEREELFFTAIQEKLEMSGDSPNEIERREGIMDYQQFLEAVRDITVDFLRDQSFN